MDMQNIKPLHDRVLVRRVDLPQGLIVIPEQYREASCEGQVVAVGPGKRRPDGSREPMAVKPGDVVMFTGRWNDAADQLPSDYTLIQQGDIWGTVPKC